MRSAVIAGTGWNDETRPCDRVSSLGRWLRGTDSNRRPSGYGPDELPLLHPAPGSVGTRGVPVKQLPPSGAPDRHGLAAKTRPGSVGLTLFTVISGSRRVALDLDVHPIRGGRGTSCPSRQRPPRESQWAGPGAPGIPPARRCRCSSTPPDLTRAGAGSFSRRRALAACQATAGGRPATSHAVGPYACEQEVSCGDKTPKRPPKPKKPKPPKKPVA